MKIQVNFLIKLMTQSPPFSIHLSKIQNIFFLNYPATIFEKKIKFGLMFCSIVPHYLMLAINIYFNQWYSHRQIFFVKLMFTPLDKFKKTFSDFLFNLLKISSLVFIPYNESFLRYELIKYPQWSIIKVSNVKVVIICVLKMMNYS